MCVKQVQVFNKCGIWGLGLKSMTLHDRRSETRQESRTEVLAWERHRNSSNSCSGQETAGPTPEGWPLLGVPEIPELGQGLLPLPLTLRASFAFRHVFLLCKMGTLKPALHQGCSDDHVLWRLSAAGWWSRRTEHDPASFLQSPLAPSTHPLFFPSSQLAWTVTWIGSAQAGAEKGRGVSHHSPA